MTSLGRTINHLILLHSMELSNPPRNDPHKHIKLSPRYSISYLNPQSVKIVLGDKSPFGHRCERSSAVREGAASVERGTST